ncbi:MAG: NDP-sugar synthase [Alicyclobacillaceae bacterium]|nr:NDP-sugar synthase [Alicyclobacillaceae bacterium]
MKALVLAGGKGTRLRPLTEKLPKPMVPVANRPQLEHLLLLLRQHGIDEVVITLGYCGQEIADYFRDGTDLGIRIAYVREDSLLGTGGAIVQAKHHFDDTFLVCNADIVTDLNVSELIHFHLERNAMVTIATTWVEDPTPYGLVETDSHGRIRRFLEKPSLEEVTTNYINAGMYVLEPAALEWFPLRTPLSIEREVFPRLLERGKPMYAYKSENYWIDMGTPEKYLLLHRHLLSRIASLPGCVIPDDGVAIDEKARVHAGAKVVGPVLIGPGAEILPGATVGPFAVIGKDTRVASGATVRESVLWNGVRVGDGAQLIGSVVGEGTLVPPAVQFVDRVVTAQTVAQEL